MRKGITRLAVLFFSGCTAALVAGCGPSKPTFPPTEKRPVTDVYHGITVVDNYRWLDDLNNPSVKSWVASENTFTQNTLGKIPYREAIAGRLKQLLGGGAVSYSAATWSGRLFLMKSQPPKEQPFLVTRDSPEDVSTEKTVVDPNAIDAQGSTAIDFYVPSHDGRLVAVSLSRGGSEDGSASVFETATGRRLEDVVPRVNFPTAAGSVAWNAEGTGFYYTRYPQGSERSPEDMNFYQQVYFHRLGTPPAGDRYVIGKEFPRIAEIELASRHDGRYLVARVANGDGGEFAYYLMSPGEKWKKLSTFSDGITLALFGRDGRLYLLSTKAAPHGKILTVPLARPDISRATTIVPESNVTIEGFCPTLTRLYVRDVIGGPSQVRVFDLRGRFRGMLPTGPVASVTELIPLGDNEILYGTQTYLEDFAFFRYNPARSSAARTQLANRSSVDYSDCEVIREVATSRDGTKLPMSIIRRKGAVPDGNTPLILYGYGAYGITERPTFSPRIRIWLDRGGMYVYANLRGGGEFGEEWHAAGKLTNKQNVFDDFIACTQCLIEKKYTSASRLAIEGRSNGGLLMGAVLTQRPDLFRAVVSHVGIYDMLRVELFPNGAFNVTEFGSVKDPDQFKALLAYSPYQHVTDGTSYPAVLLLAGDNDGRVDPANSRKMTARLQAATSSANPVMLRTSSASGHGIGSPLDEITAEDTDVFSFLFDQLKVPYTAAGK